MCKQQKVISDKVFPKSDNRLIFNIKETYVFVELELGFKKFWPIRILGDYMDHPE